MATPDATAAPEVISLDNAAESPTTALYRAAIGPISRDYYLPIFTRFEAADRSGPSWNWSAGLYTLNWLLFRQLEAAALIYGAAVLCALLVVFGIDALLPNFSAVQGLSLGLVLGVLFFVLPGVFGNALLHAACRKKMEHALAASKTLKEACAMLESLASSRRRFIWLVLANLLLACVAAAAYIAFQSIGTPTHRAATAKPVPPTATDNLKKPVPITVTTPAAPASQVLAVVTAASSAPLPPSAASAPAAPVASTSTPAAATPASVPAQPAAVAPRYYINVGLFAQSSNARKAHAKLIDAGLVSVRQAVKSRQGKLIRVRVGPFDSRAQADAAAEKIHALQLDAIVIQK